MAESAEDRKAEKYYRGLPASHSFTPVAIETLGAIGPRSMLFLRDLGRRIALESGEPRSTVSGGTEGERSLSAGWHEPLTHSFCDTLICSWF